LYSAFSDVSTAAHRSSQKMARERQSELDQARAGIREIYGLT
jgi:hypothetical protein